MLNTLFQHTFRPHNKGERSMNKRAATWLISEKTGIAETTLRGKLKESFRETPDSGEMHSFEYNTRKSNVILDVSEDGTYLLRYCKEYHVSNSNCTSAPQVINLLRVRYGIHARDDDFITYSSDGEDFVEVYVGAIHAVARYKVGGSLHIKLWRSVEGSVT